jgi:hypothetical protein
MYSFRVNSTALKAVEELARARRESTSDMMRALLRLGMEHVKELPDAR